MEGNKVVNNDVGNALQQKLSDTHDGVRAIEDTVSTSDEVKKVENTVEEHKKFLEKQKGEVVVLKSTKQISNTQSNQL